MWPCLQIEALLGQVADEAAGEAIARAGGIEDFLQQIARNDEMPVAMEQDGAVLAALDDQRLRPHLQDLRPRPASDCTRRKACAPRRR